MLSLTFLGRSYEAYKHKLIADLKDYLTEDRDRALFNLKGEISKMTEAIKQHYVPQFLLKKFSILEKKGKAKSIFVFNKVTGKEYQSAISDVATERYFYEVKGRYSIENNLISYEDMAAPIINRIIEDKSIKSLTKKEKTILAKFIAIQILRVPTTRYELDDLSTFIFQFAKEINSPETVKSYSKASHCKLILDLVHEYSPFLSNKDWILYESKGENYIIGDNPVVLHNTINEGELGLKSEGVEIYLPLSPIYCLALVCKSVRKTLSKKIVELSADIEARPLLNTIMKFHNALKNSETSVSSSDVVVFVNSLQTESAERFLYSNKKGFDLPKKILNPL